MAKCFVRLFPEDELCDVSKNSVKACCTRGEQQNENHSHSNSMEFAHEELGDNNWVRRVLFDIERHRDAFNTAEKIDDKEGMGTELGNMGNAYNKLANTADKAIDCHRRHLKIAEKLRDKRRMARAYEDMGNVYRKIGKYGKASDCCRNHLKIAKELENKEGMERAHGNLGNLYYRDGKYKKAIDCHHEALKIAEELEDKEGIGRAFGNIGNVYSTIGEYQKAIDYHNEHLAISEQLGDKRGIGRAQGSMGNVFYSIGKYQEAIDFHRKDLEIAEELNDKEGMGSAYGNIGNAYYQIGQNKNAIECHRKHLEIAKELGDKGAIGRANGSMGNVYNSIGQYLEAIDCHCKHLEIAKEMDDRRDVGRAHGNMGNVYTSMGQYQRAIDCYSKHLEIAEELEDKGERETAEENMRIGYENIGEYQKVIDCYRKHLELAEKMGDIAGIRSANRNIEMVNNSVVEHKKKIDGYVKAIEIAGKLGNERDVGRNCGKLGEMYNSICEYQKAIDWYRKDLDIAEKLGDKGRAARTYDNIGIAHEHMGEYQKAIDCHRKHLEIAEELVDKDGIGRANTNMGVGYDKIGQYQKAMNCYRKAFQIAKELDDKEGMTIAFANIGNVYDGIAQCLEVTDCRPEHLGISEDLAYEEKAYDPYELVNTYVREDMVIAGTSKDEPAAAIAENELGKAGLQRESDKCDEHQDIELITDVHIEKENTVAGTTDLSDSNVSSSSEINTNRADTKPFMNETQSANGQQKGTNEKINIPTQCNTFRKSRAKTKCSIYQELKRSLKSIKYVKGFGVIDEKLMIHVLEDHELPAEQSIMAALKKHPFDGEYCIKTFRKTDKVDIHAGVGGLSLYRQLSCSLKNPDVDGTIGCLLQFQETQGHGQNKYDNKIYAVTRQHVVKPEEHNDFICFYTIANNDLKLNEFSNKIELHMLNRETPVDIALIPVDESSAAFNFEHDNCKLYDDDLCELEHKNVQKQGAMTGLTNGKIISVSWNVEIEGEWYDDTLVVESSVNNKEFSRHGDSGSLVTLSRNAGEETHKAVSMVFGGGEVNFSTGEKVTFTFPILEGINLLLENNNITNEYVILPKFGSKVLEDEDEYEEITTVEPSLNTNGVYERNSYYSNKCLYML